MSKNSLKLVMIDSNSFLNNSKIQLFSGVALFSALGYIIYRHYNSRSHLTRHVYIADKVELKSFRRSQEDNDEVKQN